MSMVEKYSVDVLQLKEETVQKKYGAAQTRIQGIRSRRRLLLARTRRRPPRHWLAGKVEISENRREEDEEEEEVNKLSLSLSLLF